MRVVLDTNVLVSAFLVPASQGEAAFLLARRGAFELCTSVPILTETARVLREKFEQSAEDVTAALKLISRAAEVCKPRERIALLADPDNRILECARAARADLIVTGDRHILALRSFEGTPVVRLADFLRMFPPTTTARGRTHGPGVERQTQKSRGGK